MVRKRIEVRGPTAQGFVQLAIISAEHNQLFTFPRDSKAGVALLRYAPYQLGIDVEGPGADERVSLVLRLDDGTEAELTFSGDSEIAKALLRWRDGQTSRFAAE